MEIEIVDAYPLITKSGKQSGWSMAIYLIDLDMDLRGILATKTKKGWFFSMPFLKNFCQEKKDLVKFPIISFVKREKNLNLMKKLRQKGTEFLEKKIKSMKK